MDKTQDCGSCNPGSTPGGNTNKKQTQNTKMKKEENAKKYFGNG